MNVIHVIRNVSLFLHYKFDDMKNVNHNPILKGFEDMVRPIVTKKAYDPETLKSVPKEIISYEVIFILNNKECQLGTFTDKDEAILCVAEKHDDLLSQYGWDENADDTFFDSPEYFEADMSGNHVIIKIMPKIKPE